MWTRAVFNSFKGALAIASSSFHSHLTCPVNWYHVSRLHIFQNVSSYVFDTGDGICSFLLVTVTCCLSDIYFWPLFLAAAPAVDFGSQDSAVCDVFIYPCSFVYLSACTPKVYYICVLPCSGRLISKWAHKLNLVMDLALSAIRASQRNFEINFVQTFSRPVSLNWSSGASSLFDHSGLLHIGPHDSPDPRTLSDPGMMH